VAQFFSLPVVQLRQSSIKQAPLFTFLASVTIYRVWECCGMSSYYL